MRVLYIASGSIREPLIQSQVLRYLERNGEQGCEFDLVTFERQPITADEQAEWDRRLARHSINWIPRQIVKGRRSFGMLRDIADTTRFLSHHLKKTPCDLIHARSFLPGNIGARLRSQMGIPLLYDMRGFWAKEKFAYGHIRLTAAKWLAQKLENRVFDRADYLVSLTNAGIDFFRAQGVVKPIRCIPCCVDLDAFRPADQTNAATDSNHTRRLVSVGSLGRGYRCDAVLRFANEFQKLCPGTILDLITRTDPQLIDATAAELGISNLQYQIRSLPHDQVASEIATASAGICMVAVSEAKIASCPTKLAEYLACGIPVVANIPIGDVESTLSERNTGVTVRLDSDDLAAAAAQLKNLLRDPNVGTRARQQAVDSFGVADGAAKYLEIYHALVS